VTAAKKSRGGTLNATPGLGRTSRAEAASAGLLAAGGAYRATIFSGMARYSDLPGVSPAVLEINPNTDSSSASTSSACRVDIGLKN
jgi:hypothetical protein